MLREEKKKIELRTFVNQERENVAPVSSELSASINELQEHILTLRAEKEM